MNSQFRKDRPGRSDLRISFLAHLWTRSETEGENEREGYPRYSHFHSVAHFFELKIRCVLFLGVSVLQCARTAAQHHLYVAVVSIVEFLLLGRYGRLSRLQQKKPRLYFHSLEVNGKVID